MWEYNYIPDSYELYHHGVKGMKWGVRRSPSQLGHKTGTKRKKKPSEPIHEDYKKAHSKKSVSSMSDAELRNRNNRLQMERQYAQLTKKNSKGKKIVSGLIATAGTIAAAEGAYKTYKRVGNQILDKLGDYAVRDIMRKNIGRAL